MSPVISEGRPPFQKFSRPWRTDEHELSLTNLPVESLKSWFANWSPRKFVFGSDTDVAQLSLTNCHTNAHTRTHAFPTEIVKELCIPRDTEYTHFSSFRHWIEARKYIRENNRINFEYLLSVNSRQFIDQSNFTTTIFSGKVGYRSSHILQASRELNFTSRTRYRTNII